VLVPALGLLLLVLMTQGALAAPNTVTGTVQTTGGSALVGINVQFFDSTTGALVGSTITIAGGAYSIATLPDGTFKVLFNSLYYAGLAADAAPAKPAAAYRPAGRICSSAG